jgi:hypothetical protein
VTLVAERACHQFQKIRGELKNTLFELLELLLSLKHVIGPSRRNAAACQLVAPQIIDAPSQIELMVCCGCLSGLV